MPVITELQGWQYFNGRRVAVRRTDAGFIVSKKATRGEIVRGMVALLGKPQGVPAVVVTPPGVFSGGMTFKSLPYLSDALHADQPGKS